MFSFNQLKPKACLASLLLLALCGANLPGLHVHAHVGSAAAQSKQTAKRGNVVSLALKLKPAAPRPDKMSPDLLAQLGKLGVSKRSSLRVVCQFNAQPGAGVNAIYQRPDVHVDYSLQNFNFVVATMPASVVGQ